MSKYVLATNPGGSGAAVYQDGDLIDAGDTDEVQERLLTRLGVEIRTDQQLMPEGKWGWRDAFPALTTLEVHNTSDLDVTDADLAVWERTFGSKDKEN